MSNYLIKEESFGRDSEPGVGLFIPRAPTPPNEPAEQYRPHLAMCLFGCVSPVERLFNRQSSPYSPTLSP